MKPITTAGPSPVPKHVRVNDPEGPNAKRHAAILKAATDLETAFLAEMLKSTGLGKARDTFGGGAGEDQFNSLLIRAQAEQMTRAGGIGLAESLYHALLETENDTK